MFRTTIYCMVFAAPTTTLHGKELRPAPSPQTSAITTALNRYRAQVTLRFLSGLQKRSCREGDHVTFHVLINAEGTILKIQKVSSSTVSTACEEAALLAINRASPLPAPPAQIAQLVLKEQFSITFRR